MVHVPNQHTWQLLGTNFDEQYIRQDISNWQTVRTCSYDCKDTGQGQSHTANLLTLAAIYLVEFYLQDILTEILIA